MMRSQIKLKRPKGKAMQVRVIDRLAKDTMFKKDRWAIGLAQKCVSLGLHPQKLPLQSQRHSAIAAIMRFGHQQQMPLDQRGVVGQQEERLALRQDITEVLAGAKRTIIARKWHIKRGGLLQTHELIPRHITSARACLKKAQRRTQATISLFFLLVYMGNQLPRNRQVARPDAGDETTSQAAS